MGNTLFGDVVLKPSSIVLVEGNILPEVWEGSLVQLVEKGSIIDTEYGEKSIDAPAIIVLKNPFAEPRIHLKGIVAGSLKGLLEYVDEVIKGIHDNLVEKFGYTYHERLFAYKLPGGMVIDQIREVIDKLKKAPYTRRAQAITWQPWKDLYSEHPPCLPPNELILTPEGPRRISEINVGDKVLTHKGRVGHVVNVMKRYYKGSIIKIKPYYLPEVRLTPDHPVLVIKGIYGSWYRRLCKPICKVMVKDFKDSTCPVYWTQYRPEWIEAFKLTPRDFVLLPLINVSKMPWKASIPRNIESAYIIDLLTSNGSTIKDDTKITVSSYEDSEKIAFIFSELGYSPRINSINEEKTYEISERILTPTICTHLIPGEKPVMGSLSSVGYGVSVSIKRKSPMNIHFTFSYKGVTYIALPIKYVVLEKYEGYVYNLEVEPDNSYLTLSFAVHNCLQRLWFRVVNDKLVMHVHMRSNDALKAAFMNIYAFTELQKYVAQQLGVEPGCYIHMVDSYHVYERDWKWLNKFVEQIRSKESRRRWITTQEYLNMISRLSRYRNIT